MTRIQRLRLMLWKNYLWHRYYWWFSIIQIISRSILVIYSGITLDPNIGLTIKPKTLTPNTTDRTMLFQTFLEERDYLAYAPSTPFTDKLMKNVQDSLKELKDEFSRDFELVKLPNEEQLQDYMVNRATDPKQAEPPMGVVFLELGTTDTLPNKLVYKIRQSDAVFTERTISKIIEGPRRPDARYPEEDLDYWGGFTTVQLSLNEEFIRMKSNGKSWSPPDIYFQAFPYPEVEISLIKRYHLLTFFCLGLIIFDIVLSVPFITAVTIEKRSGVKELLKLYGVEESTIWLCWFLKAFILIFISMTLTTILFKVRFKGDGSEYVRYTIFPVLWTFFMLFSIANIIFNLFLCALSNRATLVTLISIILQYILFVFNLALHEINFRKISLILCLLPANNLIRGIQYMRLADVFNVHFDWSSLMSFHDDEFFMNTFYNMLIFIFEGILYSLLTIFLNYSYQSQSSVSKTGILDFQVSIFRPKKPVVNWLQKNECRNNFQNTVTKSLYKIYDHGENDFVESHTLSDHEPILKIEGLYKRFESTYALNGIDLEFHRNEITAILGHKNAGKTTFVSILTGKLIRELLHTIRVSQFADQSTTEGSVAFTDGSVHYKGEDISSNLKELRNNLGVCYKKERSFYYVSVLHHLIFYGMLKGLTKKEAEEQADHYLEKMEMERHKYLSIKKLSKISKKKLSIAISLIGSREILLLDEPFADLDHHSKRQVWDLITELRSNRTIILTSNYEEGVDEYVDRIVILEKGVVITQGTPDFLKQTFGQDYEMMISGKKAHYDEPGSVHQDEILYEVPVEEYFNFSLLFGNTPSKQKHPETSVVNLNLNDMKHVKTKNSTSSTESKFKYQINTAIINNEHSSQFAVPTAGSSSIVGQFIFLFSRKISYVIKDYINIFVRIVLPTLIILLLVQFIERIDALSFPIMKMSPSVYVKPKAMLHNTSSNEHLYKLYSNYLTSEGVSLIDSKNDSVSDSLLNYAGKDLMGFRRELLSVFELDSKITTRLWHNLRMLHSLPITISSYSNVLLMNNVKKESAEIITFNHPVHSTKCITDYGGRFEVRIKLFLISCLMFFMFGYCTIDVIAYIFEACNKEVTEGFMHAQITSGVSIWIYWLTSFIFDFLFFVLVIALRVVAFKVLDQLYFFKFNYDFGVFVFLTLAVGLTGLFYVYSINSIIRSTRIIYLDLITINLACNVCAGFYFSIKEIYIHPQIVAGAKIFSIAEYTILSLPFCNFLWIMAQYIFQLYHNNKCNLFCPHPLDSWCELHATDPEKQRFFLFDHHYDVISRKSISLGIHLALSIVLFIIINLIKNRRSKPLHDDEQQEHDESHYDTEEE